MLLTLKRLINMTKKQITPEELRNKKLEFLDLLAEGKLSIGQATKFMRKITGLTQQEYAKRALGIYPRVLMEIEADKGNPTLKTLQKIAKPFGLKVAFIRDERKPTSSNSKKQEVVKNIV